MNTRAVSRWGLCALLLAGAGCYREATDPPAYGKYDGTAPLTVEGLRPGATRAEVLGVLGEPERKHPGPPEEVWNWNSPAETHVTFDGAGRARAITGATLKSGKNSLIWGIASPEEVKQFFGRPVREENSYRPRGSGVVSIGRVLVSQTLVFRADGLDLRFYFHEGRLRNITALTIEEGAKR